MRCDKTYISYGLRQVRTDTGGADLPVEGPLGVLGEELVGLGEGALAGLVAEGAEGVLEDVGGVGGCDETYGSRGAVSDVFFRQCVGRDGGGTSGEEGDGTVVDIFFDSSVGDGVCGGVGIDLPGYGEARDRTR